MPPKRKNPPASAASSHKKTKSTPNPPDPSPATEPYDKDTSPVLREYYPPELSNARALEYSSGARQRPIEELETTLKSTIDARSSIRPGATVVHWFRGDFRLKDNTALSLASKLAQPTAATSLIGLYIFSPQDFEAHVTSPARVDFILRSLEVLQKELEEELRIPLHVEVVEKRRNVPSVVLELAQRWGAKHVLANMEYEVDELRRDAKVVSMGVERGISFEVVHDSCVVAPGCLQTKSTSKQFAVYTPWYRAWLDHVLKNPSKLTLHPQPRKNHQKALEFLKPLFKCPIPSAPPSKSLTPTEKTKLSKDFPAGEQEAIRRLEEFIKEKVKDYATLRNFPAKPNTSALSVYFSAGTLSPRTAVTAAMERNGGKINTGDTGVLTWISEVAWREFYKHVLVAWPYVCMNKPFKPSYSSIAWNHNPAHFKAWCAGQTGYPIIDAAMRQLTSEKYMHNRPRMIVASFLAKDLLLDWRMGEKFFMSHLIDGDFASNNGGWGFSSSAGVDPQPYFRVFNPLLQGQKFDPEGMYVKRWVPELRGLDKKDIHDPFGRLSKGEFAKLRYPEPIVVHNQARLLALERYKEGIKKGEEESVQAAGEQ